MNAEELWLSACQLLKSELPDVSYHTWIEQPLKPYALIGDILLMECVAPVMLSLGTERYMPQIQRAVNTAADGALKIEILSGDELTARVNELKAQIGRAHV